MLRIAPLAALLVAPALAGAQSVQQLEERFGWREWRLGSEIPADLPERAELRDGDECYAWYTVAHAGDLYDVDLGALDLTYLAGRLAHVTVNADFDSYDGMLAAVTDVYGYGEVTVGLPYDEDYGYPDDGEDRVVVWEGDGIRLTLARTPSELGRDESTTLTYDWLEPEVDYATCAETREAVYTLGEF